MWNTSSASSHWGDFSLEIFSLLISFLLNKHLTNFCLRFQCSYTLTLSVPHKQRFCWTSHNHNSPADWVREIFKPSEDAGSLVVHIFSIIGKRFWTFCFFVGAIIMRVGSHILAEVIGPCESNQWLDFLSQSFIGNKAIIQVWQKATLTILAEGHNSPANWAGELFKHSTDAESLVVSS